MAPSRHVPWAGPQRDQDFAHSRLRLDTSPPRPDHPKPGLHGLYCRSAGLTAATSEGPPR